MLSWFGLLLAVVLLAAGGLLTWGSSFVGDQVHDQLSQQDITMPTEKAIDGQLESGRLSQADADALRPFAGEVMTTGPQARAFADHYILAHMNGGTGSLFTSVQEETGIDLQAIAESKSITLPLTYQGAGSLATAVQGDYKAGEVPEAEQAAIDAINEHRSESLFKGSTLRGMLLYGYAFATIGTIAGYAAIGAFIAGAILLVLAGLGFVHAKRAKDEADKAGKVSPATAAV